MKQKIIFTLFLAVFSAFCFSQNLQSTCGQGYVYYTTDCKLGALSGGVATTTNYLNGGMMSLAVGPNFGFQAPNPTFWVVYAGNYCYHNGSGWVNTGHSAGGNGFGNPGGSKDFIYNINAQGQVSKYNGTGNATVIATYSNLTSANAAQDIVGDINNNFYLVRHSAPSAVMVFDQSGALTCTYAISAPFGGAGLAIANNKLFIAYNIYSSYGAIAVYELQGDTMVGSNGTSPSCSQPPYDLASCPTEAGLFSPISSTPSTLGCTITSMAITSGDTTSTTAYAWSGPGISGASNTQSITVTAPGTYTRTAINCAGLISIMTHTVKYDSTPPPLSVYQSSKIKCAEDKPVTLAASGLFTSYKWEPANSLSSSLISLVQANPTVTTTYSVTGYVNGCERTAVMTVSANPLTQPVITATSDSICAGSPVSLAVPSSIYYVWHPGNVHGNSIVVSPITSTEFTVTGTDMLGCKTNATHRIAVVQFPNLNAGLSKPAICEGETVSLTNTGAEKYFVMPGNYTGASLVLSPLASSIYTVTGNNWNCAETKTIEITVNKLPLISATATKTLVCTGEAVEVTASGAQVYNWDDQPGTQINVFYPNVSSEYKITGVDDNGCKGELMISVQVSECTGMGEFIASGSISVYPNPASGYLFVHNQFEENSIVEIIDVLGKILSRSDIKAGEHKLQLNEIASGLYTLRVSNGSSVLYHCRITVQ